MEDESRIEPDLTDIAVRVVSLLRPLGEDERRRVLSASCTLLGTVAPQPPARDAGTGAEVSPHAAILGPKAQAWIKGNGLRMEQIEQVFDISPEGVSVIAAFLPGKDKKEQTHNAYVTLGVSRLLSAGKAEFDDKAARELCEQVGCINKPNHARYMDDVGNLLVRAKDGGWRLTAPGLKHAADLVKQLATGE